MIKYPRLKQLTIRFDNSGSAKPLITNLKKTYKERMISFAFLDQNSEGIAIVLLYFDLKTLFIYLKVGANLHDLFSANIAKQAVEKLKSTHCFIKFSGVEVFQALNRESLTLQNVRFDFKEGKVISIEDMKKKNNSI